MKISALALALLAGLAVSTSAHASTVSFDLGTVSGGQTGSFTSNKTKDLDYFAKGVLPANTEIVFTYNSPSITSGILSATGKLGSDSVSATSTGGHKHAGSLPVLATADLYNGNGKITIENTTSSSESFSAFFLSLITGGPGRKATISFVVSAIPLPATFVLFFTGLVAMAGFGAYRKKSGQI